jgi:hypothetical protein
MRAMLLLVLALLLGGCTRESPMGYCKEQAFSLTMSSTSRECNYQGSWIERLGDGFICRCPGTTAAKASASAE